MPSLLQVRRRGLPASLIGKGLVKVALGLALLLVLFFFMRLDFSSMMALGADPLALLACIGLVLLTLLLGAPFAAARSEYAPDSCARL